MQKVRFRKKLCKKSVFKKNCAKSPLSNDKIHVNSHRAKKNCAKSPFLKEIVQKVRFRKKDEQKVHFREENTLRNVALGQKTTKTVDFLNYPNRKIGLTTHINGPHQNHGFRTSLIR